MSAGTNIAAQISPDGRWIAIDLAGVLWVLPGSGGPARRLTSDLYDIAQPAWAPDSRTIIFQSYRHGSFDLWTVRADGSRLRRLTSGPRDHREPRYSPDGTRVVFSADLSGSYGVHVLHVASGAVSTVADSSAEEYEPSWSPDGSRIAFVVANTRIDVVEVATGTRRTAVSVPAGQVLHAPAWTPDGAELLYSRTYDGRAELWRTSSLAGTGSTDGAGSSRGSGVSHGSGSSGGSGSSDGAGSAASFEGAGSAASFEGAGSAAFSEGAGSAAGASSAERVAVADGVAEVVGEDVFPFRVSWRGPREFVYTADGQIRRRTLSATGAGDGTHTSGGNVRTNVIGFSAALTLVQPQYRRRSRDFDAVRPRPVVGIGSPVLSPDGMRVAFRALNDIWTMTIGQAPRPVTRDSWWKCDPAWSPDGRYLSYSSDRGGSLNIWLRDLRTGEDRQLSDLAGAAAVSGSWSPDSARLAFLDQTGALYTVEVATGEIRRVYPATFEPGRPTWSADGRTIALAAIVPFSARFREGLSKILLVDVATSTGRYVDPLPERSIQTRGDDGPVWSPDGTRMAFVVASVLYVADVYPDGTIKGPPRQVTREVTDAPSWSGDSSTLLYLHNGTLRLVPATGGTPRTVRVALTWANTAPRGRTVIRAGRLWDGLTPNVQTNIDVVIEGHRITAVEPIAPGRDGHVIDARGSMVIPGLVDMHHHREMQGYAYGARQGALWLSLGVTTTRSPGSPAYHMVEERESVQSGARIAPRYFATGEAVDGSRIYYNFMRPTFDDAQLALELSRAGALDYDLMKAYVRLSPERQRKVIAWAHAHGVPSTSHYHYPAFAFGGDGMEHVGATSRFGYSRTVTALGNVQSDVATVFTSTGATLTPTLFNAMSLLREDDSLVTDERVRILYPAWEYTTLQALVAQARTTDQTVTRENLGRQVAHVARVLRGGGRVISGTDSPIAPNAVSLHYNLRAMVAYGMTPFEALTTATRIPGEVLAAPLGVVRPGAYADLAVLGGDPLTDIRQAANVRQVVANGVVHEVAELVRPFAALPTRPVPLTAHMGAHPDTAKYWWHDPAYLEEAKHACCEQG
ncbi:amidohydrolase family protein [Symbioplanes lichenis]|uniref:amidohydrolase family protein n=1 Tax=Symbioplanes lichenis TaxID=1629072 RepID=UPI0027390AF0|nr:amidohydrolase family protein [Actinoplanes lichenis]